MFFQQYFSYIVEVSFIGGGNQGTQRKTQTCRKSLTNYITKTRAHSQNTINVMFTGTCKVLLNIQVSIDRHLIQSLEKIQM